MIKSDETMNKNGFVLYKTHKRLIKRLSIEERGELLTAILDYENGATKLPDSLKSNRFLITVFDQIIKDIKDNDKKHQQMCEERKSIGKLGGAPVGNKNATKSRYAEPQENNLPPLETIENDPEPIEIEEIHSQSLEKTKQNNLIMIKT
jgi:hypothetical protein